MVKSRNYFSKREEELKMNSQTKYKRDILFCDWIIMIMLVMEILMIALAVITGTMMCFKKDNYITDLYSSIVLKAEPILKSRTVTKRIPITTSYQNVQIVKELQKTPEYRMNIDSKTYEVFVRVVEAEVTGDYISFKGKVLSHDEILESKIRVAQVFMNRVEDVENFSYINDLYESLTYKNASSTFNDGRYYTVEITDITREAVDIALLKDTPDYTDGALYFSSGTTENKYGELLFVDDVGHAFFK